MAAIRCSYRANSRSVTLSCQAFRRSAQTGDQLRHVHNDAL